MKHCDSRDFSLAGTRTYIFWELLLYFSSLLAAFEIFNVSSIVHFVFTNLGGKVYNDCLTRSKWNLVTDTCCLVLSVYMKLYSFIIKRNCKLNSVHLFKIEQVSFIYIILTWTCWKALGLYCQGGKCFWAHVQLYIYRSTLCPIQSR